ncbi:MAG: DUF805 domain-containing protein [Rhodospirillaceae bacterium]|nr:DUF805 domain-containing protein [Rhodospirillaceae bacterium]
MGWFVKAFTNYVGFQGRARRREFWFYTLVVVVIMGVLSTLFPGDTFYYSASGSFSFHYSPSPIVGVAQLVFLLPSLAVSVRRLHDTGRSGWWVLIGLIPIVGAIVLIVFFCQDSVAANQHGPNPKVDLWKTGG